MASIFGLFGSALMMLIFQDSDLDGFLITAYAIFIGLWQGIHSQAETIYTLNSTNSSLVDTARMNRVTWELIGAILASLVSFIFVKYA